METKTCGRCKENKPVDNFRPLAGKSLGRFCSMCRPCEKQYFYEYNQKNKEKRLAKGAEWRKNNHEKMLGYKRKYNNNNRDKIRASGRLRRSKTSEDVFNSLLREQDGLCAVCREPETTMQYGKAKGLAADHCHQTNKTRGLLCQNCNLGIGRFDDNIFYIENAIAYLSNVDHIPKENNIQIDRTLPDFDRRKWLKDNYNISLESYNRHLKEQGDVCRICKCANRAKRSRYGTMHVDHEHNTGDIRGIICALCNTGLGAFKDNTRKMKLAINYLNKYKKW